jgi:Protein of unknown function (DUF2490)
VGATLLLLPCLPAHAQTSTTEFFPEIDTYFKPTSNVRIVFQAKETREGGDPTQVELGPSVEFYLKPLLKLQDVTVFDLDDSKSRPVVLSVGYRYVPSPDKPTVNRLEPVATFHFPMKGRILISDRNRFDLDWSNGSFTWRYRNRLTVERRGTIRSYHPGPHVSAEVYYESQYSKWSTTALYAGCLLPLGKHVQIDPYYEHENNTGKSPNQQVNAAGLILRRSCSTQKMVPISCGSLVIWPLLPWTKVWYGEQEHGSCVPRVQSRVVWSLIIVLSRGSVVEAWVLCTKPRTPDSDVSSR